MQNFAPYSRVGSAGPQTIKVGFAIVENSSISVIDGWSCRLRTVARVIARQQNF